MQPDSNFTKADDDMRPAAFDARLAAYLPGLRKQATHYNCDADDLVSDTVEYALRTWRDFREGGGFWWWLQWRMRQVVALRRKAARTNKRDGRTVSLDNATHASTAPQQEDYLALVQVLESIPAGRSRDIVLRSAMGEEGPEIGARYGIGRERVRQIVRANRAKMKRMAA